ncbi:large subunit ribosomal protein L30 [Thermotomaculum hydrothermale]|uniref:Large ribosomal subunit protein uL30 n=1 Tax=Thermotomaculum hydrothermale TaxID=981385 RepID=A0A7R6SZM6_9BACT|nr:50S ribosomal protein L30 [Thermotomaculum hydrothermale]BBB32912.1 large subunit ribosomal protein L30 [Thermotomaculum hydrothermale]
MGKKVLVIKQIRSGIGRPEKHKRILKSLGFRKLNQVRVVDDVPEIRGQINKIPHLVEILEEKEVD